MTPGRVLLGTVLVLVALLLQTTVLSALPLPGAAPDLLVVLVVAYALAGGPRSGAVAGFATGLAGDLVGDAPLGRTALAYALVGCAAGLAEDDADRSVLLPFVVVGLAVLAAVGLVAAQGLLLGDPRVTAVAVGRAMTSTVPYTLVLTPVVPAVAALLRRTGTAH